MKPRERFAGDDPREWLNRAHSNLARARLRAPDVYLEDLCYDAQQAAEKAVKGLLLARGIQHPFTHDLSALLSLVEQAGLDVPPQVFEGVISNAEMSLNAAESAGRGRESKREAGGS